MLSIEVRALTALTATPMDTKTLAEQIHSSYTRTTEILKKLEEKRFILKENGQVRLTENLHTTLFRKNVRRYDLTKLLGGKAENIAIALLTNSEMRDIQKQTGLTYRTLRRILTKMMETGAIKQDKKRLEIVDDRDLRLFITSLNDLKTANVIESYAEIVPNPSKTQVKRVPTGKIADGYPTAFSAFHQHGIELRTTEDYYTKQKPTIEEILIHALLVSTTPQEVTDCAVFLAKNLPIINLGAARRKAREFGVGQLLLDTENYIRNLTLTAPEKFLPWNEYAEKARLYGIDPNSLLPRMAYPDFFKLLSEKLATPTQIYVFGGEAMRFRNLKRATKDVDIALPDNQSYTITKAALTKLGYKEIENTLPQSDLRLNPSGIFEKSDLPRVDLFAQSICGKLTLTSTMLSRAERIPTGNLDLRIASNEDLLLLKAVTEREGDIQDMMILARSQGFRWDLVLQELLQQEETTGNHFCMDVFDSIEIVEERTNIRAPIHNKLENRCLDQSIIKLLEHSGPMNLKKIHNFIDYPEYRITSRLKHLIRANKIKQSSEKTFTI